MLKHLVFFFLIPASVLYGQHNFNGFRINDPLIPVSEIVRGGPPKDGIRAIDHPQFILPGHLDRRLPILGVYHNGIAKAYPLNILDRHEVVNDFFSDAAVVVTYCPLCSSGIAFEAKVYGQYSRRFTFGVSGLLYNSDVLLFDRETESLWSQIMMQGINGPSRGKRLMPVTTIQSTLGEWLEIHPGSIILSEQTGFDRDY